MDTEYFYSFEGVLYKTNKETTSANPCDSCAFQPYNLEDGLRVACIGSDEVVNCSDYGIIWVKK